MSTQLTLPQIFAEVEAIARDAQSTFGHLNAEQLNWKPSADQWSVAQCLDHLMASNGALFFQAFDQMINGTKRTTFIERLPLLPDFFGWMVFKAMAGKQKYKAPAKILPSVSALDPQIVGQFVAHQQKAIEKMKAIEKLDPASVIITSPFASFVTYSVLDACRIIVAHERRHFAQAERVMATSGFPQ